MNIDEIYAAYQEELSSCKNPTVEDVYRLSAILGAVKEAAPGAVNMSTISKMQSSLSLFVLANFEQTYLDWHGVKCLVIQEKERTE